MSKKLTITDVKKQAEERKAQMAKRIEQSNKDYQDQQKELAEDMEGQRSKKKDS